MEQEETHMTKRSRVESSSGALAVDSKTQMTVSANLYVLRHELMGHSNYCFAWLDNAVCPQVLNPG